MTPEGKVLPPSGSRFCCSSARSLMPSPSLSAVFGLVPTMNSAAFSRPSPSVSGEMWFPRGTSGNENVTPEPGVTNSLTPTVLLST